MHICFFGTYDRERPRNKLFIKALKKSNVYVDECFFDLWHNIKDKSQIRIYKLIYIFSIKRILAYFILLFKFSHLKNPDVIIVGYFGHFDVWLARLIGSFYKIPVVFIMHISLYDTVVLDRKLFKRKNPLSKILLFIDRQAILLSDLVIVDTKKDIEYFSTLYKIKSKKFVSIFIGADEEIFHPTRKDDTEKWADIVPEYSEKVLFYGQFIPLQGVEYIIAAAEKLSYRKSLKFIIVGTGQEKAEIKKLADDKKVKNIEWIDWVSYNKLPYLINKADIILGIFGITEKTNRVIPNKVYQSLACAKPVLTAKTSAVEELLAHKKSAFLCSAGDSQALADSILYLIENRQIINEISENGYKIFKNTCFLNKLGKDIVSTIKK